MPALTEPAVCRLIAERTPANAVLFFGNSMPIRDMDAFGGALPAFELPEAEKPEYACYTPQTTVFANRGASGIDGCIATAAGIAHGLGHPVVAVIGDVAALHDLNSLALLKQANAPVVLVVLNNDGGGIFHFLPVAEAAPAAAFERLFATPHGMRFEHAAAQFGLRYERPGTLDAFRGAFDAAFTHLGPVLIEVVTNREENVRVHRVALEAVRRALDDGGGG